MRQIIDQQHPFCALSNILLFHGENGERPRAIGRVGFHSLRHSFVSLCAKAGAPQHVVQKRVGHGSPAMTEHYTHADADQKREAIAVLPELTGTEAERAP